MVCNQWKTLTSTCAFLRGIQVKLTRLTKTHTENLERKQVPTHQSTRRTEQTYMHDGPHTHPKPPGKN